MKRAWAVPLLMASGCLEVNPDRVRPDMAMGMPDLMCSQGPGVNAKSRAEVMVPAGNGPVGGTGSYAVAAFYLDVTEITVGAYRECMNSADATRCKRPPRGQDYNQYCNFSACPGSKEKHPVNCIDWQQADDFCRWAGRRLPTEVEWEYAAGGAVGKPPSKYPWGTDEPVTDAGAQLCWNRSDGTCEVDGFARTLLGARNQPGGVADLAGNVWEWTNTTFTDPAQSCVFMNSSSRCSVRGGSWNGTPVNFRASLRNGYAPMNVFDDIGARCARTP